MALEQVVSARGMLPRETQRTMRLKHLAEAAIVAYVGDAITQDGQQRRAKALIEGLRVYIKVGK